MARKKSLDELDAELAELEAELASLEEGGAAAPPRPKKAKKAPRRPELPEEEAAPEGDAPSAAPPKRRKFGFRKERAAEPEEEAPEEAPSSPAEPEEPKPKKGRLPFGRRGRAEPEPPAAAEEGPTAASPGAPAQAPAPGPGLAWHRGETGWRVGAGPPQAIPVVRRRVDAEGRVLDEEVVGVEEPPPAAPEPSPEAAPTRRFGLGRRRGAEPEASPGPEGEAPPLGRAEAPPPRRRRSRRILIPILILLLLVGVVAALAVSGVVDLGGGGLGIGGNKAPTAAFALSASVAAVGANITLDASASSDPEGDALTYAWEFGDGSGREGLRVTYRYSAPGTFTVRLTVRDARGASDTAEQSLRVLAPPVARIQATLNGTALGGSNWPLNGDAVSFDGSGSTADGGVKGYDWAFGHDNSRATGGSVIHDFPRSGTFQVTLTVADANGLRGTAGFTVYVGRHDFFAGQVPASLDAAQAINHTVAVSPTGAPMPSRPVLLRAVLTFPPSQVPPLPLPIPAPPANVNPDDLDLRIFDAAGTLVAMAEADGTPKQLEVTDFSGEPGGWSVQVARPQGGANPINFELNVSLVLGPG